MKMNRKHLFTSVLTSVLLLVLITSLVLAQAPDTTPLGAGFTYQGQLKSSDAPYTGLCDFQFGLWDDPSTGTQVGSTQTHYDIELTNGLFTVTLDWGPDVFQGEARWLDISVRCPAGAGIYTPLTPRQHLTATPYAVYAMSSSWHGIKEIPPGFADDVDNDTTYSEGTGLVLTGTTFSADTTYLQRRVSGDCTPGNAIRAVLQDGSVTCEAMPGGGSDPWLLNGNAGTTPGTDYLGTSDNTALELKVDAARALRLEPGSTPNLIGGYFDNWMTSGVNGGTIGGGGSAGQVNRVTDSFGTIGGGLENLAGDADTNPDSARNTTVGGGFHNAAQAEVATVGGGEFNFAGGGGSTVGGGIGNAATGGTATIGGGIDNLAQAGMTTIAGGGNISVTHHAGAVTGGEYNRVTGDYGFIGGGYYNEVGNQYGVVGGGFFNTVDGSAGTIAGGGSNTIDEEIVYVDSLSTIGGGLANYIDGYGFAATIAGGQYNQAGAALATIPGGYFAKANIYGQQAYASGRFAATGDAQTSLFVLRGETTDSTTTNLYLDGVAAQEMIAVSSGRAMAVDILVIARSSTGLAKGWRTEGVIKDSSGTVYLVGLVTSLLSGDPGTTLWDVTPAAVGNEFTMQVDGETGKTIRWVAVVRTAEVAFVPTTRMESTDAFQVASTSQEPVGGIESENRELKARVDDLESRLAALEQEMKAGNRTGNGFGLSFPWLLVLGISAVGGTWVGRRRGGSEV
jgi:hypothetical protein